MQTKKLFLFELNEFNFDFKKHLFLMRFMHHFDILQMIMISPNASLMIRRDK